MLNISRVFFIPVLMYAMELLTNESIALLVTEYRVCMHRALGIVRYAGKRRASARRSQRTFHTIRSTTVYSELGVPPPQLALKTRALAMLGDMLEAEHTSRPDFPRAASSSALPRAVDGTTLSSLPLSQR